MACGFLSPYSIWLIVERLLLLTAGFSSVDQRTVKLLFNFALKMSYGKKKALNSDKHRFRWESRFQ